MQLGLTRRNFGRLVLLAWAAALAWLARRQFVNAERGTVTEQRTRLAPGAFFYAVYAGDRQIGQVNLSVDTLVGGVRLNELLVLDLPDRNITHQFAVGSALFLSPSLHLRSLTRSELGVGIHERRDATFGPDSMLVATDSEGTSGIAARMRLRIDPTIALPTTLPYRVAFGGNLRVGRQFTLPLFDFGTGASRPLAVRVTAESTFVVADSAMWDSTQVRWVPAKSDTIHAWRLSHDAPGAPTVSWIDAGGTLVRQETAGGLTLVRSAFEIVRSNYQVRLRAESALWRRGVPGMVPLVSTGLGLDTVAAAQAFLLQRDSAGAVSGKPRLLEGGRQTLRGDTVIVSRFTPADSAAGDRPPEGAVGQPLSVMDDEIRRTAIRLVRGASSPEERARRLTVWVSRQIATDSSVDGSQTALFTFSGRRGGPDGKAQLLASMAIAAGIPARVASGLAILPEGSFGHSWTEMWLGRWEAADPSFGHYPASASLVRLLVGGRSRPVDLLPLTASARFLPLRTRR
jgi:transglutaminase-like putative cysteine protease